MDIYNLPYFKGVPRQGGVALEPWLEQSLGQLFPFSRNTFYLQQKKNGRDIIESAIPEIGGVLSRHTSIEKAVKKTAKSTIQKQVGGGMKKRKNTRQNVTRQKNLQRLFEEP